jgi:hypothetical protein
LPTVWIVGDWLEPAFAEAVTWLRGFADCHCFESPQEVLERHRIAADENNPAAIVFALSHPGQFSAKEVESLHAYWPLSRLVALTGPWCEGEMRSGRPWAGVVRVTWKSWRSKLPSELGLGQAVDLRLPRTISDVERVEKLMADAWKSKPLRGKAAIRTHSIMNYRYLADTVRNLGWEAAPFVESEACTGERDVAVCDGWENVRGDEDVELRRVLVLHFPRPEDLVRAREKGIRAVVAQPLMLSELADALER